MKTAISVPDAEFKRFDQLAERHGMNRSEFYRSAAIRFAEELEERDDLTLMANEALVESGQPSEDSLFLRESARQITEGSHW